MPLDGFRIVEWASRTFGGLPATLLGGFGVAVLIGGIILAVIGVRAVPTSYSAAAAGIACCVLAYFIVGAAISGTHSLEGGEQVGSSATRIAPMAAAIAAFGLAGGVVRLALRNWITGEGGNRALAVLLVVGALGLAFVGVQILRGNAGATSGSGSADPAPAEDDGDDTPVRHGVTGSPRR